MNNMELKFYKLPLKLDNKSGFVYDDDYNFMFQFELFEEELQEIIIEHLNSNSSTRTNDFRVNSEDNTIIQALSDNGLWVDTIIIRGWGNLTGKGSHNFSKEKAIEIQDDLVEWLLYKLNKQDDDDN